MMLAAGIMNLLSAVGWGLGMIFTLFFACLSVFYIIPFVIAIFEIICGSTAAAERPSSNIKLVAILGLISAGLMGNVVSIILEILVLVNLSRPEVEDFYMGRG